MCIATGKRAGKRVLSRKEGDTRQSGFRRVSLSKGGGAGGTGRDEGGGGASA